MPFEALERVPSVQREASEFFGVCLKVTVQGTDPPESKVLTKSWIRRLKADKIFAPYGQNWMKSSASDVKTV